MKGTTTIIRAQHRHRFLIIDLRAVEDARLFWAARGLLSYLISRPDKLESSRSKDLQHRGDLKRDGIYKLLREFHGVGYIARETVKDEFVAGRTM